jgi:tetratricopeptide (TPR) repeat protein
MEASRLSRRPAARTPRRLAAACAAALVVAAASATAAGPDTELDCGDPFANGVGPWDYNNAEDRSNPQRIPIVEKFHFTAGVESLTKGESTAYVLGDIDYTLRAVPNHHRALNAAARYDIENGGTPPRFRSVYCWFQRAMVFRPEDGTVRLIQGNWLSRKGRNEEALEAYAEAKRLMPGSVEVDYNMGLLYLKLGDYEKARESARVAYAGNYPLDGLRRKLAEKGYPLSP